MVKRSVLKITAVFALLLVSFAAPVVAQQVPYFVLGPSTATTASPAAVKRTVLTRSEFEAKKAEFRQQLAALKDTRRQTILQNLADKMNRVNKQRVEHWRKVLARLQEVLAKIQAKGTALKSSGKDTSSLDAAIASASAQLTAATAAVDSQAGREYIINIATGSGLKANAGQAISGEQADLQGVLKIINDARKAVYHAVRILAQLTGEKLGNEASPSGQNL